MFFSRNKWKSLTNCARSYRPKNVEDEDQEMISMCTSEEAQFGMADKSKKQWTHLGNIAWRSDGSKISGSMGENKLPMSNYWSKIEIDEIVRDSVVVNSSTYAYTDAPAPDKAADDIYESVARNVSIGTCPLVESDDDNDVESINCKTNALYVCVDCCGCTIV